MLMIINLCGKNKENILKRKLKVNTVFLTYFDGSNVRVSNYIKIIDKEHVPFHSPRKLQKSLAKIKRGWKANIQKKLL